MPPVSPLPPPPAPPLRAPFALAGLFILRKPVPETAACSPANIDKRATIPDSSVIPFQNSENAQGNTKRAAEIDYHYELRNPT
jgi:hypothetical protein